MVMEAAVKDLYTLVLKYKEDASKYQNMDRSIMTMDIFKNIIEAISIIPAHILGPYMQPIYTTQQQMYYTLELAPPKTADWIEIDFTIEKNKK